MRLGPAEANTDRQRSLLGCVVDGPGVAGDVEPGDAELARRPRDVHDAVENSGRGLVLSVRPVTTCLEANRVAGSIDLGHPEDPFDLVLRVPLGDVDRLAPERASLFESLRNAVSDDHDRGSEQLG